MERQSSPTTLVRRRGVRDGLPGGEALFGIPLFEQVHPIRLDRVSRYDEFQAAGLRPRASDHVRGPM